MYNYLRLNFPSGQARFYYVVYVMDVQNAALCNCG